MKFKLLPVVIFAVFLLVVLAIAVLAQEEPPPPYAGLKNPFSWSDATTQEAGKEIYQPSCLGCHGANGGNIAGANFSDTAFPQNLEERPDFYFWTVSEGRLSKGMPPFKSSLSEEQRWQVLTYLWSLGKAPPSEEVPPTKPPAEEMGGILLLTAPEQAQAGQPLTLAATLQDSQGQPIVDATVKFFIKVDFFTSGLMEIGDVLTNENGIAVFEYTPRQAGDIEVMARYETIETSVTVSLTESTTSFYQAKAGLQLPAPGSGVFIGPKSARESGEGTSAHAPMTAFRLPGGILSWLLIAVVTVMVIWATYFRVVYQVFRIPIRSEIEDIDTRLVPMAGLAIAVVLGVILVLILTTGPYTHLHLPQ